MEVDHYNPNHKKDYFQEYSNLFLATRHCNGSKSDRWPSNKERSKGHRFLNCTKEPDYGLHILEDPDSHELVGITPQGRYHVRNCDLNAPHFIKERKDRAAYWEVIQNTPVTFSEGVFLEPNVDKLYNTLFQVVEAMIPPIPYLNGQALVEHRARRAERDRVRVERFM